MISSTRNGPSSHCAWDLFSRFNGGYWRNRVAIVGATTESSISPHEDEFKDALLKASSISDLCAWGRKRGVVTVRYLI